MKVSMEIDNNFGYEKITQLVDNIPLKECAVYFNIIICVYLRYFGRKTNYDLWVVKRFSVKVGSLHNYDEVIRESNYSYTCVINILHIRGKHEQFHVIY